MEADLRLSLHGLEEAKRTGDFAQVAMIASQLAFEAINSIDPQKAESFATMAANVPLPHDATVVVRIFCSRYITEAFKGNWRQLKSTCASWMSEVRLAGRFQQATAEFLSAEASSALGEHEEAMQLIETAAPHLTTSPLAEIHKARTSFRPATLGRLATYWTQ